MMICKHQSTTAAACSQSGMNMVICKTLFNNNNYNFFSISNASDRTMIASSTIRKCFAEIIQERNGAY
jgi:hypothetical protein